MMETLTNFAAIEAAIQKDFVMIVAKTKACATCAMIVPHLNNNLQRLQDFKQYQVFVDDVDEFRGKYVIFSVPTVLIFNEGKEILRESRFINIGKVNRLIEAYFSDQT